MDISRGDSFAAFVDKVAVERSKKMTEMDLGESLFETKWWVKHGWTWKTIFVHENYENFHVESQQLVRTKPVSVYHNFHPAHPHPACCKSRIKWRSKSTWRLAM